MVFGKAPKFIDVKYGTPNIDGNIDEVWNNANSINTNINIQGTTSAAAQVRVLWDENYIYALYKVKDNILDKGSKNAYEQDSVEAFIDENNKRTPSYDSDDSQYRVNYINEKTGGGNADINKFKSFAKITKDGYLIEMAIPLKNKVKANDILGFDAQVNDATNGKRTGISIWCDDSGKTWSSMDNVGSLKILNR